MTVRGLLLYAISLEMVIGGVCRVCLVCGRDWCIRIALTPGNTASIVFPMLCVLAFMCNVLGYCKMQVSGCERVGIEQVVCVFAWATM